METELEGFEEFWKVYPRKVKKLAAIRMYQRALKKTTAAKIVRGAMQYAQERNGQDPKYTLHPASWLNAGAWDDEALPQGPHRNGNSVIGAFDRLQQTLAGTDDNAPSEDDLFLIPPRRLCGPR